MNLDQIATKCFILALFIRDDGQRLLLGDGYYDFNQKLQHFQGNTIANDVVEIQGDNGQLLAGQVMRSGAQKFEGYIGDATTNRQIIEQKRSDFMAFFRIKHFYKVIYIFPDGTAIQRQRGYLTDAPTIPEIFQKFPEYSIALNFEDANYYEYAEDEHGDEIYAHIAELALAGGATGGLIWDEIGAVSNGITWSGIQTAQGEYIQVTNDLDIPAKLASVEMLGKAEQTTYSGKNLADLVPITNGTFTLSNATSEVVYDATLGKNVIHIVANNRYPAMAYVLPKRLESGKYYAFTFTYKTAEVGTVPANETYWFAPAWKSNNWDNIDIFNYGKGQTASETARTIPSSTWKTTTKRFYIDPTQYASENNSFKNLLFSLGYGVGYGSITAKEAWVADAMICEITQAEWNATNYTDEDYEPYVGGTASPNPTYPQPISVVTGENVVKIEGKNLFDKSAIASGKLIDRNTGVLNNSANYATSDFMQVQAGKRYTFTGFNYWYVAGFDKNKNYLTSLPNYATYTIPEGVAYIRAGLLLTNLDTAQFEQNDQATTYEPYQAQEFEVNLGKNLFKFAQDSGTVTRSGITIEAIENGAIRVNGTVSGDAWFELMMSNFLQPIQNTTTKLFALDSTKNYTLSVRLRSGTYTESTSSTNKTNVYVQTTSTNTQKNSNLGGTPTTFTGADGIYRGWMRFIGGYTFNNAVLEIQLEEGSEQTSYAPYFTPIELAKIGNYQDRIYKDEGKWYVEKQVGKVVLDGTEDGWGWADTARYTIATANIGAREAISDHFAYVNYTGHASTASPSFDIGSNLASIGFHDKDITSLANFKTWLASNPTTVYYALATPTTTEITNEALIAQLDALGASSLYLGLNNIGTETQNAAPTLKIEYYTEYTLDGAGYEWEPGGNTARTIVTVAGVDSAWPIWTVQGGAQNPTLTNITTGQTISWQGFVPEGQTLTINMAEMTADLAGANVFEYITGEWLRLAPGNNTLVYNAGNADKPSTLSWNGVLA